MSFSKNLHTKNGIKLMNEKLSYTIALELVPKQLSAISLNPRQYGIHGLRLGGARPATAFGILDRIIMRYIGWKLQSFKNRHIQECVDSLFASS